MDIGIYNYNNTDEIAYIEFSILGNREVTNMSVIDNVNGIEYPELNDKTDKKLNGLIDPKMGTTDNSVLCSTCKYNVTYCPGHFGHITLAKHYFHIGFIAIIKKILSLICIKCSNLLIDEKDKMRITQIILNKSNYARINELKKYIKNRSFCPKCNHPIIKIKSDNKLMGSNLILEYKDSVRSTKKDQIDDAKKYKYILTAEMCYNILNNISSFDKKLLGFDPNKINPADMIYKNLIVPPMQVRPSTKTAEIGTKHNDLTHSLADIIKINEKIKKNLDKDNIDVNKYQETENLLQIELKDYMDKDSTLFSKSKTKRDNKSLTTRYKRKESRVRSNLMGKRVDFSARTVISPDPLLNINEVGIPLQIAKNITMPEIVTPKNIERMKKLIQNGRDMYVGANFVKPVEKFDGKHMPIDLRYGKDTINLKIGDIVERHIQDGDIILFNRQPTLQMQSMMGLYTKIIDDMNISTFRINISIVKPYNADFDGDEMNCMLPQSIQSAYELEHITNLKYQLITPQSSLPIIAFFQDALIGYYELTKDRTIYNWKNIMNILSATDIELPSIKNKKLTGHDMISYLIPNDININMKRDNYTLIIENGKIKEGIIDKKSMGDQQKNSLLHLVIYKYGYEGGTKFINNNIKMITNSNLYNGFTLGINDLIIKKEAKDLIRILCDTKKIEMNHLITSSENNPNEADNASLEKVIFDTLNILREESAKIVKKYYDGPNNLFTIIDSGAKGSTTSIGQISGCFGQVIINNTRANLELNNRSLHYYCQYEETPEARGFIQNPLVDGLTYSEMVFVQKHSRASLITVVTQTPDTGYIQRKLVKSEEDLVVQYDNTVRTAKNGIIQFVYGDIGYDPKKQYDNNIDLVNYNYKKIEEQYSINENDLKKFNCKIYNNAKFIGKMKKMKNTLFLFSKKNFDSVVLHSNYMFPINFRETINNIKNKKYKKFTQLTPDYVVSTIKYILKHDNTPLLCIDKTNNKSIKHRDEKISKKIIKIALYYFIAPKKCIYDYGFSAEHIDEFSHLFIRAFRKSLIEPGFMVGLSSALALGEISTQVALHSKRGSLKQGGIERIKELLNVTKNIKTPVMTLYLKKEYRNNLDVVNKIKSYVQCTTWEDIINTINIIYDPSPDNYIKKDNAYNHFFVNQKIDNFPWLLRIKFNRETLFDKNITLLDIKNSFIINWKKRQNEIRITKREEKIIFEKIQDFCISSNNDNNNTPIVHIRFEFIKDVNVKFFSLLIDFIYTFKIRGIENFKGIIYYSEEPYITIDPNTGDIINDKEYVINTQGINLVDIKYLKYIDINRCYCNDIIKTYELYGIEAARTLLIREFTFTLQSVTFQHFSILVDLMTYRGSIIGIDRYGMNKQEMDIFARASFEQCIEQLFSAAIFNEKDNLTCTSSRVMAGLVVRGGTGFCNLILDTDLIENSEPDVVTEYNNNKTINNIETNSYIIDIVNKNNTEDYFMNFL